MNEWLRFFIDPMSCPRCVRWILMAFMVLSMGGAGAAIYHLIIDAPRDGIQDSVVKIISNQLLIIENQKVILSKLKCDKGG